MKNLLLVLLFVSVCNISRAQLKVTKLCPEFIVNILEGNVNGIEPNHSAAIVKKEFPCYTSEIPEADSSRCGGILSYQDKDIYFYTGRDYIQIGPKFKGKLSLPLMGAARSSLFRTLGHASIKDVSWDAFKTQYGILILHYNSAAKVNLIQFSKKSAETIRLCE